MKHKRIIVIAATLALMISIGLHITSCGGSGSSSPITAPDATTIKTTIAAANPTGMVPGLALAAITMPECESTITLRDIVYAMTGLPTWLAFDITTRELTLAEGLTVVPEEAITATEVTYTCALSPLTPTPTTQATNKQVAADASDSASVNFVVNDLDSGGATDGYEYAFGEVPLVNNSLGWFWLDPGNVDLYRTPETSPRRIPTGITVPQVGMDPTDAADDTSDFDSDTVANDADPNPFVAASDGAFGAPTGFTTFMGEAMTGVVAADLNGDGYKDIVVTEPSPSEISVFMNKGDGTFDAAVGYTGPVSNFDLIAADVDGDGDKDIVILGGGCPGCVWVKINDGTGVLSDGEQINIADAPRGITGVDFNDDGIVDLVVSHDSTNMTLLLGNGDGTFAAPTLLTAGGAQVGVTAADFDGDGHLDIAAASGTDIIFLMGNGDGTFAAATTHDLTGINREVASADIDGDGDIDIVTSDNDAETVHVLLNDGSGTFTEASAPAVRDDPRHIAPGDLNGDGIIDLVVACEGDGVTVGTDGIGVLIGNGDGTFAAVQNYDLIQSGNRPAPQAVLAADVDNDGDLDIATGPSVDTTVMNIFLNE